MFLLFNGEEGPQYALKNNISEGKKCIWDEIEPSTFYLLWYTDNFNISSKILTNVDDEEEEFSYHRGDGNEKNNVTSTVNKLRVESKKGLHYLYSLRPFSLSPLEMIMSQSNKT